MSSIKGFNFDSEKLSHLLKLFEEGNMSAENAQELKILLEKIYRQALKEGNLNLARNLTSILITLQGFLGGRINLNRISVN